MPLPKGTKYRVNKDNVRLAFNKAGDVIEAKSLDSGKVHTQQEFKADKKKHSRAHGRSS